MRHKILSKGSITQIVQTEEGQRMAILPTLLGEGGSGGVYLAINIDSQEQVAVKVSDPRLDLRHEYTLHRRAAQLANSSQLQTVITPLGYAETKTHKYLFMQRANRSLKQDFDTVMTLRQTTAHKKLYIQKLNLIKAVRQVGLALNVFKSHNLAHGDLYADNVLLIGNQILLSDLENGRNSSHSLSHIRAIQQLDLESYVTLIRRTVDVIDAPKTKQAYIDLISQMSLTEILSHVIWKHLKNEAQTHYLRDTASQGAFPLLRSNAVRGIRRPLRTLSSDSNQSASHRCL